MIREEGIMGILDKVETGARTNKGARTSSFSGIGSIIQPLEMRSTLPSGDIIAEL